MDQGILLNPCVLHVIGFYYNKDARLKMETGAYAIVRVLPIFRSARDPTLLRPKGLFRNSTIDKDTRSKHVVQEHVSFAPIC